MLNNEIYLYVGCGNHRLDKFLHADICAFKQYKHGKDVGPPDLICDIADYIPLKESSCKFIYSRGTLEHLKYQELINHFIECNRLMQNGGIIRMDVPDFDLFIKDYLNKVFKNELGDPKTLVGPMENYTDFFVNRTFYPDHYYLHNIDTLSRALKKCGFTNIKRCLPGETENEDVSRIIYSCENGRELSSILLEARKDSKIVISVPKKKEKSKSFLKRILAYMFNLTITRHNNRKAPIFEYMWFYDKFLIIRQKLFIKKILKKYYIKKNI
jgi:predicted SAM-dependent methyltransferase